MRPVTFQLPIHEPSTFLPAGCLHWPVGEKDLIKRWVKAVKEAKNGWTILMGDTSDAARTHYRTHLKSYTQDENSQLALDEWHRREVAELAKILKPIRDRIAGAILGNHFWQYSDGTNSEQYLCQILKIPYLGPTGIVRVEYRNRGGELLGTHVVYAHHHGGSAGGRTYGGDINVLVRAEQNFDADVYVLSHTHKRLALKMPMLTLTQKGQPRLKERTKVLIRSGAFLKGYAEDHPSPERPHFPSYAETAAYRPTDLGWVTMFTSWTSKHHYVGTGKARKNTGMDYLPNLTLAF